MVDPCGSQNSLFLGLSSGLSGLTSPARPEGPALASVGLLEGLGSPGVEECSQAPQKPEQTLLRTNFSHNPSPSPTPPFTQLQEMREMEREAQQNSKLAHSKSTTRLSICKLFTSPRCCLFQTRRTKPFSSASNRTNNECKLGKSNRQGRVLPKPREAQHAPA